jgi:hypothetical protein
MCPAEMAREFGKNVDIRLSLFLSLDSIMAVCEGDAATLRLGENLPGAIQTN